MTDQTLRETVIRLAQPVVHSLGLLVWGVEIARAGRTLVRLFVDVPTAPQADEHQAAPGVSVVSSAAGISDGFAPSDHSPDESSDTPAPAAPTSATIEQCEEISRHLALALEVEDSIPDAYVLEVSTPGLSRLFFSLDQMTRYVGDVVEARLHTPVASTDPAAHGGPRRIWRGTLTAVEDEGFVLAPVAISPEGDVEDENHPPVFLPWSSVRRATRMYIFRPPQKPGKKPGKKPQGKDAPAGKGGQTAKKKAASGKKKGNTVADNDHTAS